MGSGAGILDAAQPDPLVTCVNEANPYMTVLEVQRKGKGIVIYQVLHTAPNATAVNDQYRALFKCALAEKWEAMLFIKVVLEPKYSLTDDQMHVYGSLYLWSIIDRKLVEGSQNETNVVSYVFSKSENHFYPSGAIFIPQEGNGDIDLAIERLMNVQEQ